MVRRTRSALRALTALKTLSTRKTLASNTPMFWTMSGIRKSIRLEATMAASGRGRGREEVWRERATCSGVLISNGNSA